MKKILFIFFIALYINNPCVGQISKGAILLGGSLNIASSYYDYKINGVSTYETNKSKSYGLIIMPEYFLNNRFSMSIGIGGTTSPKSFDPISGQSHTENYSISTLCYASYYKNLSSNFFLFASMGVNYLYSHGKVQNGGIAYASNDLISVIKGNLIQIGISPGIFGYLGKRVSASFTLGQFGYQSLHGKTQFSNGLDQIEEPIERNFYLTLNNYIPSINVYYLIKEGK